MKFILVNGRTPVRTTFCLQCREKIDGNYIRETGTRLYGDYQCYARHRDFETRMASLGDRGFMAAHRAQ
jgi:hypothetical protein